MGERFVYLNIDIVETVVRFGSHSDSPEFLYKYIEHFSHIVETNSSSHLSFQKCLSAANIIYECIVDDRVDEHWKALCLDNISHFLEFLTETAFTPSDKQALLNFRYRLSVLCSKPLNVSRS